MRKNTPLWLALLALAAVACDDGDADPVAADGSVVDGALPLPDAQPAIERPQDGLWSLSISFAEVGDLVLGFQLDVRAAADPDRLESLVLRVVDQDGAVSGDLATLQDLPLDAGAFVADFVDVTLPADFSPTGSDIVATLRLAGEVRGADFMCGTVTGAIQTLSIDVVMSTFGAVPWLNGLLGPASCDGAAPRTPDAVTQGDRPAAVYLPEAHATRADWPIVLVLHGYSTNGTLQAAYLGATREIDALGYVLVVPEGTVDGEGNQFWNASAAWASFDPDGVDDVAYLRGLLDQVAADYRGDRARVYAMAHSNGSFMAYRLACDGVALAGLGTLAGGEPLDGDTCAPASPTKIVHAHGTEDGSVEYAGREGPRAFPGAEETVRRWAARNGCGDTPADGAPRDLASVDGAETVPSVYPGCAARTELWRMQGGGHVPGLNEDYAAQLLGALFE